jgi:hypothetical protein
MWSMAWRWSTVKALPEASQIILGRTDLKRGAADQRKPSRLR